MKTHPVSAEELMAYLDGEINPEREQIAAHLEGCRLCQQVAADLRSVELHLHEWNVDTGGDEMTDTLLGALHARKSGERQGWRLSRWLLRPAAFSAAALAALLLTVLVMKRTQTGAPALTRRTQSYVAGERSMAGMTHAYRAWVQPQEPPLESKMAGDESLTGGPTAAPAPPMIVRTAQLTLTAANFDGARAEMDKTLKQFGGHVAQLDLNSAAGAARSFTASLRIPAPQLDAALAALRRLGYVDAETQGGEEVTQRYVDIDARLNNSRRTEERLLAILKTQTGKLSDVLAVEEQLDKVRGQIETTEVEQKQLRNQIALATVELKVNEEYKPPLLGNDSSLVIQIRNASVNGFRTAAHGVVSCALWLLEEGPSLVLIALVLFLPARMLWRRRIR